ncbi:MAG: winged helix-turn-helix transcriptional regulator [Oscillospiraceae bacterium]|nr:winged helix-turn-helix transcriptional regulator [Oscillospiraceae bacterium]MCI9586590.1 winged helix-turn-helix transcriptional regulator [Oscillospiraceae bacterium]
MRQLDRINKALDDIYHEVAVGQALSDSALNVFYSIHVLGDGCLQRDICKISFLSKQTIHSSVCKLCAGGYLRMEAGRGRDMHIHLTPAGRRVTEECVAPLTDAEERALAALSDAEQEALLDLMGKYVETLRRETRPLTQKRAKGKDI